MAPAFNGLAALLSMLNSCASGVSVVNIDNGFGAGFLASTASTTMEGIRMKTLYLECAMGASGDMLMGALVSLLDAPEDIHCGDERAGRSRRAVCAWSRRRSAA